MGFFAASLFLLAVTQPREQKSPCPLASETVHGWNSLLQYLQLTVRVKSLPGNLLFIEGLLYQHVYEQYFGFPSFNLYFSIGNSILQTGHVVTAFLLINTSLVLSQCRTKPIW